MVVQIDQGRRPSKADLNAVLVIWCCWAAGGLRHEGNAASRAESSALLRCEFRHLAPSRASQVAVTTFKRSAFMGFV